MWDHWPTEGERQTLLIDRETGKDQWGHEYHALKIYPSQGAICSCCEADFHTGGFFTFAPAGRERFRFLVCPEHVLEPMPSDVSRWLRRV